MLDPGGLDRGDCVVAGTDGSPSATAALHHAAKLARSVGAVIHIVAAYRPATRRELERALRDLPTGIDCLDGGLAQARAALGDAGELMEEMGVRHEFHAIAGEPAQAICEVAERTGASLIVVGNRGVEGPRRAVLRPVCEQVRRCALCRVVVVDTEPYWRRKPASVADEQRMADERQPRLTREWAVLLIAAIAVFMALLDVTIVNVAFPSIHQTFSGTSLGDLSWVLNGYNVVIAALLVPAGRLADRMGQRRVFFAGIGVFLVGSVLCGAADSAAMLIAARVLQAAGAAALIPTSLGLALAEFAPERRAMATSLWAAAGAVAAATGPSLGGWLVDSRGWRWVFFVNLVIALALLPARRLLVERQDPESAAPPDLFGAALLAAGIGVLALGIVRAPDWGWTSTNVLGCLLGSGAALAALGAHSRRHPSPVLEPELMRIRLFAQANFAFFLFSMAFYAMLLGNILYLTQIWHYSVLQAGFAVTPGPLFAAVAAGIGGRLTERAGPRPVAICGAATFTLAALLYRGFSTLAPDYLGHWLPAQILSGLGIGLAIAGFTSAGAMDLPPNRLSTGTAVSSCFRQIGAVLGIAILIAIVGVPNAAHPLAPFEKAWSLMALSAIASGICAARCAKRRPGETPEPAPIRPRRLEAEIPGFERQEILSHGHRLAYRVAGSGPALVLVHGLIESSTTWRGLVRGLASSYTVIAPDLLGHGGSDAPRDGDYSPAGHAGRIRDLMNALGHERVSVVGHSLGGAIALSFAYQYPERVERLTLISAGGFGPELNPGLRAASLPGSGPLVRALGSAPVRRLLTVLAALSAKLRRRAAARALETIESTLAELSDASRRGAFLKSVRAVIDVHGQCVSGFEHLKHCSGIPMMLLWGTRDPVIPVAHALRVAELHPEIPVVLLDGVGHHPHLTRPDYVADRLLRFASGGAPLDEPARPRTPAAAPAR
ncbi:MAG: hypothetical protein NVSMB51_07950 [Solirubrobacteraceae bacterium]